MLMFKRIALAVLLLILVVPLLPGEARETLGLHGFTGFLIVLFALLLIEYVAKVAGSLRSPKIKQPRRSRHEHDEVPVQNWAPHSYPAQAETRPMPLATDEAVQRPVRRPPRLSGGPH